MAGKDHLPLYNKAHSPRLVGRALLEHSTSSRGLAGGDKTELCGGIWHEELLAFASQDDPPPASILKAAKKPFVLSCLGSLVSFAIWSCSAVLPLMVPPSMLAIILLGCCFNVLIVEDCLEQHPMWVSKSWTMPSAEPALECFHSNGNGNSITRQWKVGGGENEQAWSVGMKNSEDFQNERGVGDSQE